MQSGKRIADTDKAVDDNDDSNAELYSKQPKEFENEIEWKQWLKQPVVS
jgi:hypothetical protein